MEAGDSYSGHFYGNGKELKVSLVSDEQFCALFRCVKDATITNLKVSGIILTTAKFAGSLVGQAKGSNYVSGCHIRTILWSQVNGNGSQGGVIGTVEDGVIRIDNCYFISDIFGFGQGYSRLGFPASDIAATLGSGWTVSEGHAVPDMNAGNIGCAYITGMKFRYHYTGEAIDIRYSVMAADGTQLTEGTDYTAVITENTVPVDAVIKGYYVLTLTIDGNGTLNAASNKSNENTWAAGIGNGYLSNCCPVIITQAAIVTAVAGEESPRSIGKGLYSRSEESVTIGCTLDGEGKPVGGHVGGISTSPFTYFHYTIAIDDGSGSMGWLLVVNRGTVSLNVAAATITAQTKSEEVYGYQGPAPTTVPQVAGYWTGTFGRIYDEDADPLHAYGMRSDGGGQCPRHALRRRAGQGGLGYHRHAGRRAEDGSCREGGEAPGTVDGRLHARRAQEGREAGLERQDQG